MRACWMTAPGRVAACAAGALVASAALAILASTVALAQHGKRDLKATEESRDTVPAAYEPLAPLIGEWEVSAPGAAPAFVEKFSWGPKRSYVWVEVRLLSTPGDEHLHFEGLVVFNASTRRFDYLFVVEPGSLTQERGEFRVEVDGTIVRDVALIAASGETANFRQTFKSLSPGNFRTTLMRETAGGWVPTFPGSDNLTMVRRTG